MVTNLTREELIAALRNLLTAETPATPATAAPPVDDYYAIQFDTSGKTTEELPFAHHAFDIDLQPLVGVNKVIGPYDPEFPQMADLYGLWPYRSLRDKRRSLGALLRWGGVATKPDWFDPTFDEEGHNRGIEKEKAKLMGMLAQLDALKV